jgi:GntR family transcriptional regulator
VNQIRSDHRPLYQLVIDHMKQLKASGEWTAGTRLPSENELAKRFGVSRATLREALRILEEEGFIIRKHGIGTFIAEKQVFKGGIEQLFSVTEWIRRTGYTPGTSGFSMRIIQATDEWRERFDMEDLRFLYEITRIRTANEQPVVFCRDIVPVPYLTEEWKEKYESLLEALTNISGIEIRYAIADILPVAYDPEVSPLLQLTQGETMLLLEQLHYDAADRPIIFSTNYFRADKFHFHVMRKRQ